MTPTLDLFKPNDEQVSGGVLSDGAIRAAIKNGAVIAYSISGGKDSTAAAHAVHRELDRLGHPRGDRIAIHADLGRAEWRQSHDVCVEVARHLGVELVVVRRAAGDMVARWEQRFVNGKRRYENLEIFNLIGPWSSASLRFCTSEMKQQVISPYLAKRFPGRTIVSVIGIRREESDNRENAVVSKPEPRWGGRSGASLISWNPILEMTEVEVFSYHDAHDLPLHEAYTKFGCSRVSCAFCVLQKQADQQAAVRCADNIPLYLHLVGIEANSSFSFQPTRWLADVAPSLLPDSLARDVMVGKAKAQERRALEAAMPKALIYKKGWPERAPTPEEAVQVAEGRARILGHHGLRNLYPNPSDVITRFEELLSAKAERESRDAAKAEASARRLAA